MDRINWSHIALIPKRQGTVDIGDFRPISLSNLLYLIEAKLLVIRLQDSIDVLISPFKSAFIPDRQMTDNMVLVGETVAAWKRGAPQVFMEGRLCQGIRLPRLAVHVDYASAEGFSRRVDMMG